MRADSQEPVDKVLIALRRIMRSIDVYSRQLAQEVGLTTPQLVLLRALDRSGPVAMGDLARAVNLSHATVTGIVDRLEKRSLVERRRDEGDRRRILLSLAPAGRIVLATAPSPLQERFTQRFSKLPDWEQTQILSALQRIAYIMDAEELEAAPVLSSGPLTMTEQQVVDSLASDHPPETDAKTPNEEAS